MNRYFIFAVNNPITEQQLEDTGLVVPCRGSYNGVEEASFVTPDESVAYGWAKCSDQESILEIRRVGYGLDKWNAILHFLDPIKSIQYPEGCPLGLLEEVDEKYAKRQQAWTEIDNRFYCVTKEVEGSR